MRAPPQQRRFRDGRLHLQDGPIDLIIEAFADEDSVETAYAAAWTRFVTILDELCDELPLLRAPATPTSARPSGAVALRMAEAVAPLCAARFITPMAAVAGAVAEEILTAMTSAARLQRAYVNNGGDIALHLLPDETFTIGMVDRPDKPSLIGRAAIGGREAVRGVATSGWRGRSFSLGIADAVTVLARSAAVADAAATLIANAVDLPGHPSVCRVAANARDPQSDLGSRLVTIDVGPLTSLEIGVALAAGLAEAERLRQDDLVIATALQLCGRTVLCDAGGIVSAISGGKADAAVPSSRPAPGLPPSRIGAGHVAPAPGQAAC
jgi:ApbE superfamily uncharacterized protein (UPF0280 family)